MSLIFATVDDDGVGHDGRIRCFGGDPRPYFPDFATLVNPAVVAPVTQYGALGMAEAGQNPALYPGTTPPWFTCPFLDWCDGPELEGAPQPVIYTFRWRVFFNLRNGLVFYNRSGQSMTQAPLTLFPAPLNTTDSTDFTLSFDANARPVFGYADTAAGTVNLARFVAGVPTFHSWAGSSPKLIFDGQMQRDNTLTDVVCYYLRAGILRARFQRDNFGVEYTIADVSATYGLLTRLTKTDRNLPAGAPQPAGNPIYHYIFALGTPATVEVELRSLPYPPFAVMVTDAGVHGTGSNVLGGSYDLAIVPGGSYADAGGHGSSAPVGGDYFATVIISGPYTEDEAAHGIGGVLSGDYFLVIVAGGSYVDEGTHGAGLLSGDYFEAIILGGTYTDDAGHGTNAPVGGVYA